MILSIDGLRMLRKARLSASTMNVLYLLLEDVRGNQVIVPALRQLADMLGMDAPSISRAISSLEASAIVQRVGRGGLRINPHIGFRGTALQQRAAVREWDGEHRPVAVA